MSYKSLIRNQKRIRKEASPAQKRFLERSDKFFNAESEMLDNDMDEQNRLRGLFYKKFGFKFTVTQMENFTHYVNTKQNGEVFRISDKHFVKDAQGNVHLAHKYIYQLEQSLINIVQQSQFTSLNFFGLIKLAFKRLLKRSN